LFGLLLRFWPMEDFMVLQEDMVYPTKPKLDHDFCGLTFVNSKHSCKDKFEYRGWKTTMGCVG
jgi:hypothetical protein